MKPIFSEIIIFYFILKSDCLTLIGVTTFLMEVKDRLVTMEGQMGGHSPWNFFPLQKYRECVHKKTKKAV